MAVRFVLTKVDDTISWFVQEKMIEMNAYFDDEFYSMFEREHHTYVHINKQGTIAAFGMVHKPKDIWLFGYSWHDGTIEGRRAYVKGIKFLMDEYGLIGIQEHNLHINKLRRLIEG